MIRFETAAAASRSEFDDLDYSSFDEEELEIISGLLDKHRAVAATSTPGPTATNRVPVSTEILIQDLVTVKKDDAGGDKYSSSCEVKYQPLPPYHKENAEPIVIQCEGKEHGGLDEEVDTSTKAPYDRYRATRKGLSVTDLISNIWCEQQFEFYLTKGRKRSTPAMKRGTKIHKKLEQEVHETVPVEVTTREDVWGLKLMNMIQGLKSLRETGMTRELPVFAFVKDYFIQGIIDEISYTKPEEHSRGIKPAGAVLEENREPVVESPKKKRGRPPKKTAENIPHSTDTPMAIFPEDIKAQSLMSDFVNTTNTPKEFANTNSAPTAQIAYISDCKTRVSNTLPTASQYRATAIQLMTYRFLLSSMATPHPSSCFPSPSIIHKIASLQNLDPNAPFSDSFIAQMAPLLSEEEPSSSSPLSPHPFPTFSDLLSHNSLSGLFSLLQTSLSLSIPSLGNTLSVSYRSQTSSNSSIIATKTFEYDPVMLDDHLDNVMAWWKGERETRGVEVEEAWKCRGCEFADECGWRLGKVEEVRRELEQRKMEKRREDVARR